VDWSLKLEWIVVIEDMQVVLFRDGEPHKMVIKELEAHGYNAQEMLAQATAFGAALDQLKILIIFQKSI
jgi:hypothetical protein